jgi:selenide,water dikinase
MVGLGAPDDAAVWRLDARRALVVTTDFFTPVVDDPFDFGQIAAANALSDLYAMGAQPFLALNLLMVPTDLPTEAVAAILRGGAEKVREAGAVLAGGHSVQDREPKYGLVAIGMADPEALLIKGGARPGDILVLTKPLGTGVTATALKNGRAAENDIAEAVSWMKRLNDVGGRIALENGLHGATDVTGFGLLGHLSEMVEASGCGAELFVESVPFLGGARGYAAAGEVPGGTRDNRKHFGKKVEFEASIDEVVRTLLFDAQTSGGLLLAVSMDRLPGFLTQAVLENLPHWPLGRVIEEKTIRVRPGSLEDMPAVHPDAR